jgi:hypothetical protein
MVIAEVLAGAWHGDDDHVDIFTGFQSFPTWTVVDDKALNRTVRF